MAGAETDMADAEPWYAYASPARDQPMQSPDAGSEPRRGSRLSEFVRRRLTRSRIRPNPPRTRLHIPLYATGTYLYISTPLCALVTCVLFRLFILVWKSATPA